MLSNFVKESTTYQDKDLCSEVTIRWVTVSRGSSAWGWGRLEGRGSLLLLRPAAWISTQGMKAVWSPSSFFAWFSFWFCIWGSRGRVGVGWGGSPGGVSKLGISLGLLHWPFTHRKKHWRKIRDTRTTVMGNMNVRRNRKQRIRYKEGDGGKNKASINKHWVTQTHTRQCKHTGVKPIRLLNMFDLLLLNNHTSNHWKTHFTTDPCTEYRVRIHRPRRHLKPDVPVFRLCRTFHTFAWFEPMKTHIWPPLATSTCTVPDRDKWPTAKILHCTHLQFDTSNQYVQCLKVTWQYMRLFFKRG